MDEIERALIALLDGYPTWIVAVSLTLAAISSFARYWATSVYGRIREYPRGPVGIAIVLLFMALFYWYASFFPMDIRARAAAVRVFLTLYSASKIAFNWGAMRAVTRGMKEMLRRRWRGEPNGE